MDYTLIGIAVGAMLFTGAAMVWDIKTRTIPNWLTVSAFVLAIVFQTATGGVSGLLTAIYGFAVGFGVLVVLWLVGGAAGGDVKMMGALGAWLGGPLTVIIFIASAVVAMIGLVIAGIVGFFRKSKPGDASESDSVDASVADAEGDEDSQSSESSGQPKLLTKQIPYAVPVAIATWGIMILKVVSSIIVQD